MSRNYFITEIISRLWSNAIYRFEIVCAWTPCVASTTNNAPSQAAIERLSSYEKSTCPGVSIRFKIYSSCFRLWAQRSLVYIPSVSHVTLHRFSNINAGKEIRWNGVSHLHWRLEIGKSLPNTNDARRMQVLWLIRCNIVADCSLKFACVAVSLFEIVVTCAIIRSYAKSDRATRATWCF